MSDYETVGEGVTRIDAKYVKPGVACFYLLESAGEYAVIETGTSHSVPLLLDLLEARNVAPEQLRYVIPTHVHLDHAGGAGSMMRHFANATLLIHPRGERHMADPEKLVGAAKAIYGDEAFEKLYGDIPAVDPSRIEALEDGATRTLGERSLLFRHTTGHAKHHFCVWDELTAGWFTGDMFGVSYDWFRFEAGNFILPTTTPSQFDPDDYLASLELLKQRDPAVMYLTHSGALPYSSETADLLASQVARYSELALSLEDAALPAAIESLSLDLLRPLAPELGEADLQQLLSLDMPLNLMGLRDWRDRRAA